MACKFESFLGRKLIYSKIGVMIKDARESIRIITTENGISRMRKYRFKEYKNAIRNRGVVLKIILPITRNNLNDVQDFINIGAYIRNKPDHGGNRFVNIDSKELMAHVTSEDEITNETSDDAGIWTDAEEVVGLTKRFFDGLWDSLDTFKKWKKETLIDNEDGINSFIVHGHDDVTKLELKNYLQNTLGFNKPIILHERPNLGRTLIEKFEEESSNIDIVFVLLTPDDKIVDDPHSNREKRQARQNVIFELGYFYGIYKRRSGKVVLCHKGPIELPTDISGIIYIDISNGIEAAGEKFRLELKDYLVLL